MTILQNRNKQVVRRPYTSTPNLTITIHTQPKTHHMTTTSFSQTIPLAAAFFAASVLSAAAAISTFDIDAEGWSAVGDIASPATFSAAGGNPGGYISIDDAVTGGTTYFVAPAKFLGDQSASYATPFTFDLRQSYPGAGDQFDNVDIFLVGAGLTLVFDTALNPPNNVWTSYSAPLTETAGWRIDSLSGAPSQAQMQNVLGNVTSLRLRAEFQTGSDTGSLDNVNLVPEPSCSILLLSGAFLTLLRRSSRVRERSA